MEFNRPSMDEQASSHSNYFTQLALREGYLDTGNRDFRTQTELREAILREIEKERIRQEIIAVEIARKRSAEEELRRPPQTAAESEHQLSSQRQVNNYMFPFVASSAAAMRYESTSRFPAAEEMIGMSLEERLGILAAARRGFGRV